MRASCTRSCSRASSAISTASPTPPYLWPTSPPDQSATLPITLAIRPGAVDLAAAWQEYALDRDTLLTRRQRSLIAAAVAARLGDASVSPVEPESDVDRLLIDLA